jgi:hypothetical protein
VQERPRLEAFRDPAVAKAKAAEIGYQYRLTPGASILVGLGGQAYLNTTGWGPLPSLEGLVSLRFYLDAAQQFSDEKKSKISPDYGDSYEGWRYPYGKIR